MAILRQNRKPIHYGIGFISNVKKALGFNAPAEAISSREKKVLIHNFWYLLNSIETREMIKSKSGDPGPMLCKTDDEGADLMKQLFSSWPDEKIESRFKAMKDLLQELVKTEWKSDFEKFYNHVKNKV